MTNYRRNASTVLLFWMAGGHLCGLAEAETINSDRAIVVRVEDKADLPLEVLNFARNHVERIFTEAGVQILVELDLPTWSDPPAVEFTLVLAPENLVREMSLGQQVLGLALRDDGRNSGRAYIFASNVDRHAERARGEIPYLNRERARGLILGHAVAHEVGHLLLPTSGHASNGVMQPEISVTEAFYGHVRFTPEEGIAIRDALDRALE